MMQQAAAPANFDTFVRVVSVLTAGGGAAWGLRMFIAYLRKRVYQAEEQKEREETAAIVKDTLGALVDRLENRVQSAEQRADHEAELRRRWERYGGQAANQLLALGAVPPPYPREEREV